MESALYKQRKNKLVCGVCAGIADKFGWDLPLTRVLAALLMYFYGFGILLYILLAIFFLTKKISIVTTMVRGHVEERMLKLSTMMTTMTAGSGNH